jgi:hypothetical protein
MWERERSAVLRLCYAKPAMISTKITDTASRPAMAAATAISHNSHLIASRPAASASRQRSSTTIANAATTGGALR